MEIELAEAWQEFASKAGNKNGVIVVAGGADTGRSSLCAALLAQGQLSGLSSALLDGDIGQGAHSPLCCVGLHLQQPEGALQRVGLWFVGEVALKHRQLELMAALAAAARRAGQSGCHLVVCEMPAIAPGGAGMRLAESVCIAVGADTLALLERNNELAGTAKVLPRSVEGLHVIPLAVPPQLVGRPHTIVSQVRAARLARVMKSAEIRAIPLRQVVCAHIWLGAGDPIEGASVREMERSLHRPILYAEKLAQGVRMVLDGAPPDGEHLDELRRSIKASTLSVLPANMLLRRLVSLEESGNVLGLGVVDRVEFAGRTVYVNTPVRTATVNMIRFGRVRADDDYSVTEVGG